jgi:hypothetical protein
MDELVKLVAQKTGIPPAAARTAVETVIGFLKQKLPAPLAGQVDAVLEGADLSQADDLMKGLGDLLGKK